MAPSIVTSALRTVFDVARDRSTAQDIESDLNQQLAGETWSIDLYDGNSATLRIESISVRAKYQPQQNGRVQMVEAEGSFDRYSEDREENTVVERFLALLKNRWVTVVRIDLDEGDASDIEPPGGGLSTLTVSRSVRYEGYETREKPVPVPAIRIADTHDLQSDKLEVKVPYTGSIGEYRSIVNDSIALLQEIHDDMEIRLYELLFELHYSNRLDSDGAFRWKDEVRVREIAEFLFDEPVNLDILAETFKQVDEKLHNIDYEDLQVDEEPD